MDLKCLVATVISNLACPSRSSIGVYSSVTILVSRECVMQGRSFSKMLKGHLLKDSLTQGNRTSLKVFIISPFTCKSILSSILSNTISIIE